MSAAGGSSITYSCTGNITAIGTTPTFTWNKANQMATGVLSGTTCTYLYDAFGLRLKVTVGAGVPSVMQYGPANEHPDSRPTAMLRRITPGSTASPSPRSSR